jgi:hypothetical protein
MSETRAVYSARGACAAPEALPSAGVGTATPQKAANRPVQLDLLDGRRKRRNPVVRTSEHVEQVTLMRWAALHERRWPALRLLHAVPNGGHRFKAVAVAMKAEGVKRGVPDLDLPVARGPWHGLRIELKAKGGRLTREQATWIKLFRAAGYRAEVCTGWEAARDLILEYLHT